MKIVFVAFFAFAGCLSAQTDFCDSVHNEEGSLAARSVSPLAILEKVVGKAGWSVSDIKLIPLPGDARIAANARAKVCDTPQCNCIFYDPKFITIVPPSKDDEWNAVFVLAHESAHHIRQHLLKGSATYKLPDRDKEAEADNWAGWALEQLNAPVDAVMRAADYIAGPNSENDTNSYYGRCHRRMDALDGYNRAARQDGKPEYPHCLDCFASLSEGLYLVREAPRGPLDASRVANCGGAPAPGQPLDFAKHLRGGCLVSSMAAGTLLTWRNVGLCDK